MSNHLCKQHAAIIFFIFSSPSLCTMLHKNNGHGILIIYPCLHRENRIPIISWFASYIFLHFEVAWLCNLARKRKRTTHSTVLFFFTTINTGSFISTFSWNIYFIFLNLVCLGIMTSAVTDPLIIGRVVGDVVDYVCPSNVKMNVIYNSKKHVYNGHELFPSWVNIRPKVTVLGGDMRSFFTLVSKHVRDSCV